MMISVFSCFGCLLLSCEGTPSAPAVQQIERSKFAFTQLPCEPGRFRAPKTAVLGDGPVPHQNTHCHECFPGTYSTTMTKDLCVVCPTGKWQLKKGQQKCIWCTGDNDAFPETKTWVPSTASDSDDLAVSMGSRGPAGCSLTPGPTPSPTPATPPPPPLQKLSMKDRSPEARDSPNAELSYYISSEFA